MSAVRMVCSAETAGITAVCCDSHDVDSGQDEIDLSAIDANGAPEGDQAFVFIADPAHYTGDWTGVVWQTTNPQNGIAMINVSIDGDADAEMQIYMSHPYQFTAGDFIL